mgnify:CR=1 FL=1
MSPKKISMKPKVVLCFFVFFAGALISSIFEWMAPLATIKVRNASNKVIQYLDIEYRGMGIHKGRIAASMKPGEQVTFKWTTDGEASYRLHITFEDGTEIYGGAGYIERGNVIKESVESNRLMTEQPVLLTFGALSHQPRDTTYPRDSQQK